MNLKFTLGAAAVLALATMTMPAEARDDRRGRDHQRGYHGHVDRGHDRGRQDRYDRHDRHNPRRNDHGRHDRPDWNHSRDNSYRRIVHHAPPPVVRHVYRPPPRAYYGPPPSRWARGGYVSHYNRPVYVVHDYYGRGLRHPPRGYHWVRDDYGDMLLVAIATGLITELILHR